MHHGRLGTVSGNVTHVCVHRFLVGTKHGNER